MDDRLDFTRLDASAQAALRRAGPTVVDGLSAAFEAEMTEREMLIRRFRTAAAAAHGVQPGSPPPPTIHAIAGGGEPAPSNRRDA